MARIRTIKPEFWTARQVLECSRSARLLFIGLWNFCDDAGRHVASVKQIKAEVFPGDDIATDEVSEWLQELSRNDLIAYYTVDNIDYLQVTGWHHQRIDKPQKPRYPAPVQDHSGNDPGTLPPERIGKEGIGRDIPVGTAPPSPEKVLFERGKSVLGKNAGGQIKKLRDAFGTDGAYRVIQTASEKQDPAEYVAAALHNHARDGPERYDPATDPAYQGVEF